MSPLWQLPWPDDPADRVLIGQNIAKLEAALVASQGDRTAFSLELPLEWHTSMHNGCIRVPTPEYVGAYRGSPGIFISTAAVNFGAGAFQGVAPADVASELAVFEVKAQDVVAQFDTHIPQPSASTKSRVHNLIQAIAPLYGEWIRIHPFVDGNGRTSRLLVNWFMTRYWQPLILPKRPPDDKPELIRATASWLRGRDARPLVNEFLRRLVRAQRAAASATNGRP